MVAHALHAYPRRSELSRWLVVGAIAGAVSVLVFHQPMVELFRALGLTSRAIYSTQPTAPWGVPQIGSLAFWGGVWGVLLAASLARATGARLLVASLVFGALLPTLVAWFFVAPLKGQPVAGGWLPAAMALALAANGAWGLGTGIGLTLFGRSGRG
jgi:hypothetical protein